jgi:hypothetical protein
MYKENINTPSPALIFNDPKPSFRTENKPWIKQ